MLKPCLLHPRTVPPLTNTRKNVVDLSECGSRLVGSQTLTRMGGFNGIVVFIKVVDLVMMCDKFNVGVKVQGVKEGSRANFVTKF
jgi:hypothetical protein